MREVAGEDGGRDRAGGEALEELAGGDGERRDEQGEPRRAIAAVDAATADAEDRGQEDGLVRRQRGQRHRDRGERAGGPSRTARPPPSRSARNGRSVSNELPLTTNAGTAMNSSVAHSGCGEKRRASDHIAPDRDQRKHDVGGVERDLLDVAEDGEQRRQHPGVQRRMRMAAQIRPRRRGRRYLTSLRMQRIDQRVRGLGEIDMVVALDRLIEKRKPDQQHAARAQSSSPRCCASTPASIAAPACARRSLRPRGWCACYAARSSPSAGRSRSPWRSRSSRR